MTKWVPQSPKRFTSLEIEYDGDDINAVYTFQGIQVRRVMGCSINYLLCASIPFAPTFLMSYYLRYLSIFWSQAEEIRVSALFLSRPTPMTVICRIRENLEASVTMTVDGRMFCDS